MGHGGCLAPRCLRYNRGMAKRPPSPFPFPPKRMYWGADIPRRVIRRYGRAIAEEFHPDKIILFGSYAYGTPHADSDVDLLVVMPARSQLRAAFRIDVTCEPCFPLDIIVRTPENMRWRLEEGDSFLLEIVLRGKVLYEKADQGMGPKEVAVRDRECRASTSCRRSS